MKQIKLCEFSEFKSYEELYYQDFGDFIVLYSDITGEIGYFQKWYDAEMQDRQYIEVNYEAIYLDTIFNI